MTYKEAMEQLGHELPDYISEYGERAYSMAINAMKKQIPIKPLPGGMCVCGCSVENYFAHFKYCPKCGQAIDWEETNDV